MGCGPIREEMDRDTIETRIDKMIKPAETIRSHSAGFHLRIVGSRHTHKTLYRDTIGYRQKTLTLLNAVYSLYARQNDLCYTMIVRNGQSTIQKESTSEVHIQAPKTAMFMVIRQGMYRKQSRK